MKRNFAKSIGAAIAGIAAGIILSIATDSLLESTGLMLRQPFNDNPAWLIALIVAYRTAYTAIGSYITAKLAPHHPMKHVLLVGLTGVLLGTIGAIIMWKVPPHWYPVSLVILTLPAAWFGGTMAVRHRLPLTS